MTIGAIGPERPATIPAGSLLVLLAYREARRLATSDGILPGDAEDRWLDSLTTAERAELGRWDRLVEATRAGLAVRRDATGV